MKKIILVLSILSIIVGFKLNVYAETYTDKMIISEVIDGIYYAKEKNGTTEFRMAKFKRRTSDNKIVYCIEPFTDMTESKSYKGYDENYEKLLNISSEDWERISLLAYYGYGYSGHKDSKWYPITQLLIWKTIDKKANFYYTDKYKGSKVIRFENEIKELEELVKEHNVKPSFDSKNVKMSINGEITIIDENNVIENYEIENSDINVKIEGNNLIVNSGEEESNYKITLVKKDKLYNSVPIIYVSDTYQNVMSIGSYKTLESSINIETISGTVKINKRDSETKTNISKGEGKLEGTKFNVYDEEGNLYKTITVNKDGFSVLDKMKLGTYTIKEIEAGIGYNKNEEEYKVTITAENSSIELNVENEIIKNKFRIYKYFGTANDKKVEKNIKFAVYDKNGNKVEELTTNEYGVIEFELPYGNYTLKQLTTTAGYEKIENLDIVVNENKSEITEYYLNDLKVPNAGENDCKETVIAVLLILLFVILSLDVYEKINN